MLTFCSYLLAPGTIPQELKWAAAIIIVIGAAVYLGLPTKIKNNEKRNKI